MSNKRPKLPGGNEPWRAKERHYCPLCNAWMGSDRQSILLHENGKKHRENVEKDLARRREEKERKKKEEKELERVFRRVNEVAGASAGGGGAGVGGGVGVGGGGGPLGYSSYSNDSGAPASSKPRAKAKTDKPSSTKKSKSAFTPGTPSADKHNNDDDKHNSNHSDNHSDNHNNNRIQTQVIEGGHYELEGTTYLEGPTYAPILEEGMPLQFWMGDPNASEEEKRDLRNYNYWKMGLLARVVNTKEEITCHISYLQQPNDDEETLEKHVPPHRIRLVLGSDSKSNIPETIEEAHLALCGGEQIIPISDGNTGNNGNDPSQSQQTPQIDENTGLSTWNTVSLRKISTHHYEKQLEERRQKQHEKEVAEYQQKRERELRERRMEEARYENAHDSALGAYDVWGGSGGGGNESGESANGGKGDISSISGKASTYKGVDITKELKVEIADTAKSLSKGLGKVGFKKKNVGKKKNVRKTFSDD